MRPLLEPRSHPGNWQTVAELVSKLAQNFSYIRHGSEGMEIWLVGKAYTGVLDLKPVGDELSNCKLGRKQIRLSLSAAKKATKTETKQIVKPA